MVNFKLNSSDDGFANRRKDLESTLDAIEKEYSKNTPIKIKNYTDVTKEEAKKFRRDVRQYRGEESIFKKPEVPPTKFKYKEYIPDHKLHPYRWTKYSLSDVCDDDKNNTKAALSFLKEMEARKKMETDDDGIADNAGNFKPIFKSKKSSETETSDVSEDTKCFSGSKRMMPEYVVGKKPSKKNKSNYQTSASTNSVASGTEVKLGHLEYEDE